jgi:hypothetical protein
MFNGRFLGAALLVFCTSGVFSGCASTVSSIEKYLAVSAESSFETVMSSAIQGDVSKSFSTLRGISAASLSMKDATARACMLARFEAPRADTPITNVPPAIAKLVNAYQSYWHSQLMKTHSAETAEQQLGATLRELLNADGANISADADPSQLSDAVVPFVKRRGMYALTGVTTPYAELMIWRVQNEKRYPITLTEGAVEVPVAFLDDFIVSGWLDYATCGRRGTGGWAKTDKLFALQSRYDLASESFAVSYLSHEGQHFFDYQKFPELEQPELEYRAKLAELIAARTDDYLQKMLKGFSNEAARGRSVAHPHAAFWLVENLRKHGATSEKGARSSSDVMALPTASIRAAAKALLLESSASATRLGAATVKTFLPD